MQPWLDCVFAWLYLLISLLSVNNGVASSQWQCSAQFTARSYAAACFDSNSYPSSVERRRSGAYGTHRCCTNDGNPQNSFNFILIETEYWHFVHGLFNLFGGSDTHKKHTYIYTYIYKYMDIYRFKGVYVTELSKLDYFKSSRLVYSVFNLK